MLGATARRHRRGSGDFAMGFTHTGRWFALAARNARWRVAKSEAENAQLRTRMEPPERRLK